MKCTERKAINTNIYNIYKLYDNNQLNDCFVKKLKLREHFFM